MNNPESISEMEFSKDQRVEADLMSLRTEEMN